MGAPWCWWPTAWATCTRSTFCSDSHRPGRTSISVPSWHWVRPGGAWPRPFASWPQVRHCLVQHGGAGVGGGTLSFPLQCPPGEPFFLQNDILFQIMSPLWLRTFVICVSFFQHVHGHSSWSCRCLLGHLGTHTVLRPGCLTWFDPEFFGGTFSLSLVLILTSSFPPLPQRRKARLQFPVYELHLPVWQLRTSVGNTKRKQVQICLGLLARQLGKSPFSSFHFSPIYLNFFLF